MNIQIAIAQSKRGRLKKSSLKPPQKKEEPQVNIEPRESAHDLYVKALKQAGFEVSADPKKIGKSIIVSMGDEKEFTDAISEKIQEKFKTVERIFAEMGGTVDFIPGKGNRTIKYWGNISIQGVSYVLDFTYNVGQAYTKIVKE